MIRSGFDIQPWFSRSGGLRCAAGVKALTEVRGHAAVAPPQAVTTIVATTAIAARRMMSPLPVSSPWTETTPSPSSSD
jgi:hypothetical protein